MHAETHAVPRNAPSIPPVSRTLPADSDLVLVETRAGSAPASEDAEVAPQRAKRLRPPRVEIASEPLEMVETHKEPPSAA